MANPNFASRTDWSMIADLHANDENLAADALERLVRRYWPAIFAYVRADGFDVHEASDVTQGFVADVILGRRLLHSADPEKGRVRSLLLEAIRNYVVDFRRKLSRQGRQREISTGDGAAAADAFVARWAATLVHTVLRNVREGCQKDGLDPHWEVFEARVVLPMLTGAQPIPHDHLVHRLGLVSPGVSANMLITVKRRVVRALIAEIGLTVKDPVQVEAEIHDLLRALEAHS